MSIKDIISEILKGAKVNAAEADCITFVENNLGKFYYRWWWDNRLRAVRSGKELPRTILYDIRRQMSLRSLDNADAYSLHFALTKILNN